MSAILSTRGTGVTVTALCPGLAVAHPDYYQVIFGAETIKAEHPRAASLAISGDLAHVGIDEDPETLTTPAVTDALK